MGGRKTGWGRELPSLWEPPFPEHLSWAGVPLQGAGEGGHFSKDSWGRSQASRGKMGGGRRPQLPSCPIHVPGSLPSRCGRQNWRPDFPRLAWLCL